MVKMNKKEPSEFLKELSDKELRNLFSDYYDLVVKGEMKEVWLDGEKIDVIELMREIVRRYGRGQ